jgi:Restriction endonuclease
MAAKNVKASKVKAERRGVPGRDHELLVKAIYKALLNQDQVKNLEITQNAKIQGTHSCHQIDVYWRFQSGGIDYETIVQVKKEKRPATQGHIHTFESVANDIPGHPKGIFVTQAGYQSGAIKHARGVGINLIQLNEAVAVTPSITMTDLSQAKMELLPNALAMRVTVYNTSVTRINLGFDEGWAKDMGWSLMPAFQRSSIKALYLVNDEGLPQETLHARVQHFVQHSPSGGEMQLEFTDPTYLVGLKILGAPDRGITPIKLVRMTLLVNVKETVQTRPLSFPNFATYILKDLLGNHQRYVVVELGKEEPQVILSLPHLMKSES